MKTILKALFLFVALLTAVPVFVQSDFESTKARAEAGNAEAQFNLGWMYSNGDGLEKNDQEAIRWYRLAAEQGHVSAQLNLGIRYIVGYGLAQNYQEALKWFKLAAEQGNAHAQYEIGGMYQNGSGVVQNNSTAYMWYSVAAAQGNTLATEARDLVRNHLSPTALDQAQALATRCFESNFQDCDCTCV